MDHIAYIAGHISRLRSFGAAPSIEEYRRADSVLSELNRKIERLEADARALWAYRVTIALLKAARVGTAWLLLPEEKMLAEAERLLCELPADVRAQLGERP